ncbi:aldose 1-epimerase family protein [Microbacterium halophytorum]|uniref:aldose 1-epimerase family protein n=1 Tax=Microbacterium halophytorum TaxID=2067568 RepID=UPI000CFB8DA2|nr:aldose 1-epimerase family protein [Microbacterium halophytorum]
MTPRSGTQFRIAHGGYVAEVASVGASLRTLTHGGRDLVVPFEADEVRPGYRGTTLAPWPNRIVDGVYEFGGRRHELSLTEPSRGHALHGLLSWAEFSPREVADDAVALVAVVEPQVGYPFRVEVTSEYRLGPDGLTQTVTARNLGTDAAPWGTGPHPYLAAGESAGTEAPAVNAWTLRLPAAEVLEVDDRLSPLAVAPVTDHPEWDFREPREIGGVFIDHAFTALEREGGFAEVRLTAPDGTGVAMTWDDRCPWVQVHTADTPGDRATHRVGLAVEPMTCPPDAFNSGTDLVVLEPGASHAAGWTIAAI